MFTPDDRWRCKEDLKVIIIAKTGGLTLARAQSFFRQFGEVTKCYILTQHRIACGVYTSEEDAEKALCARAISLNGMYCDVTTFKSGNRKIFISPLTLSEEALRLYFESKYGKILRFETLSGLSAAFILFLKVDSAVACRNQHHMINGVSVHARPGCTPGTSFIPDRSSMYRITPRPTPSHSGVFSQSFSTHAPSNFSSSLIPASCDSSLSGKMTINNLLEELRDRSIDEIDKTKMREKKNVDMEQLIIDWKHSLVKFHNQVRERRARITAASSRKNNERVEVVVEENQEMPFNELVARNDKSVLWEKMRKELNLPPINLTAHYAKDMEGFPMHHNGKYVYSILKDGRFRFPNESHVSFDMEKTTVKLFKREAEEYDFFGPRDPSKIGNRILLAKHYEEDDIDGWEDGSVMKMPTPRGESSDLPKWPILFPPQPRHFPLMENCTCDNALSLDGGTVVRYQDHLEIRWENTKQDEFLIAFAPFLKANCSVCNVVLDGARKQFEHIFSRPHLGNMNRHKVKYSATDFTFWNNVLLTNFHTGKKSRPRPFARCPR